MKEQIPLIYILSSGRSGSTLLDLLLGAHPKIWTLGEAQILPWEVRENRAPCGCGVLIADCDFWRPLLPKVPLDVGDYPIEYFRESHGGGKVLRWNHLSSLMRGMVADKWRRPVEEYGQLNARYFEAVWQAAEARTGRPIRWLVDASKDLYRLLWLQNSGLFQLRVIHLVKDPRAFVYSMTKFDVPKASRKTIRMTGRWLVENFLSSYLCHSGFLTEQTFRLRYEQLASKPQETLTDLGIWLGLEFPEVLSKNFRACENHAISGNKMRWETTSIRLDERWCTALPSSYAWAIWLVTRSMARKYGYQ